MLEWSAKRKLIALIAAGFLLTGAVDAWSQQQPPRNPRSPQTNTAEEQRGTQHAPLIVEVVPSKESKAKTAEDRKARRDQARYNRNVIILNIILIIVVFLQFVAIAIQSGLLKGTLIETAKSANAAKRSADIAQSGLSPVLWPRISMSRIGWPPDKSGTPARLEAEPKVKVEVENVGGSVAILETVQIAFVPAVSAPEDIPIKHAINSNRVVQSGSASQRFGHPPLVLSSDQMSDILHMNLFLWLYGTVSFADVRGTLWETEFCFRYNGAEASLEPYPPDRNKCTSKN